MTDNIKKTHWLQNPNKNYLGHWDLPNGNDMILTINSAKWEEVKNPIINTSEAKRVIRFIEPNIKPFICNETNAQSILKSTAQGYMEDCEGLKIKLYQSQVKVKGQYVDCLRVKEVSQSELVTKYISENELEALLKLIIEAKKDTTEICKLMQIESLSQLPVNKYKMMRKRLNEIIKELTNADS